jgi:hypothetical protein
VCTLLKGKMVSVEELRLMTFSYADVVGILEGNGVYDMIITQDMLVKVESFPTKKVA